MTITLNPDMLDALQKHARQHGTTPEALVLAMLREKFALPSIAPAITPVAQDDWEKLVLDIGTNCGSSLSHESLSSEGLYEYTTQDWSPSATSTASRIS